MRIPIVTNSNYNMMMCHMMMPRLLGARGSSM